jgi:hypothetical protein
MHLSHLSTRGPLGVVYEHLCNFFNIKDFTNGFAQLHLVGSHVAIGRILGLVAQIIGVA